MSIAPGQYLPYMHGMVRQLDRPFQMRISDAWLEKIDEWRRKQPDIPSRAEAIRRLVEMGLVADGR